MQDVANEILLKHLNKKENPDEVTLSFHNYATEGDDKFDLTMRFDDPDKIRLTISFDARVWPEHSDTDDDNDEIQRECTFVPAQHTAEISISKFSTEAVDKMCNQGYYDDIAFHCDQYKWGRYHPMVFKENEVLCKQINKFIVDSLFLGGYDEPPVCEDKPWLYTNYRLRNLAEDICLVITEKDEEPHWGCYDRLQPEQSWNDNVDEEGTYFDSTYNAFGVDDVYTPDFDVALSELVCKYILVRKNGWCDPPLSGSFISDQIAAANYSPMGCVAEYLESNGDITSGYNNTRMLHTRSSLGMTTLLLQFVVGAANQHNQLILRVTNDDFTEHNRVVKLNVTREFQVKPSGDELHRFLMNFIDYDTLDTLFLANWFTDDFDSTDESIVLLKTEPDRDNPKEYRAQDCRNTFHRVHGLIGDLSDEFVKTGFIPDDTVKAFQVPLYDWWDPDTDPREHVVCD